MDGERAFPTSSSSVTEAPASSCSFVDFAGAGSSSSASSSAARVPADWLEVQRDRILCEMQSTVDRYDDCFRSLSLALDDLELLRRENLALKAENLELSLLLEERENELLGAAPGGCGVLGARSAMGQIGAEKENIPPVEGIGAGNGKAGARGVVPKSISIRSKGYLAVKDPAGGGGAATSPVDVGGSSDAVTRPAWPLPLASLQVGDESDGSGIAVEVYNQGTAKTELCNKWEELGWCPYGDLCQFAHGVDELRPVIRHPRYKTQLCRMINVPGGCPYGHRCHFRHALLPKQDSRKLKPDAAILPFS